MKIGFLAMSGVRAQNRELMEIGLTLPGFVERSQVIASLPSLGLLTLAGVTPGHHEVSYHEIADLQAMGGLPTDFDLVAISTFTAQLKEAYRVADYYRSHDVLVVMGGISVSSLAQEALEHASAVVIGEGEETWPRLLRDVEQKRLQRIYRPTAEFDLREAPLPRFDLLDPAKYNRITVQTSRGCPHRCEFCASSILLTPQYKLKPVEKVINEIRAIRSIWPAPFIEFADDNSFVSRPHAKALLRALAEEQVSWFTEADIRIADDPELLRLMRDSGCKQVLIGLESPGPGALEGLELRSNWKANRAGQYLEAIERIQAHGITVNGCFILGLDGHTPAVFEEVLRFVRKSGLYEVQITYLTPFPGTPLYSRLQAEGRLLREGAWELCTLFDINFVPKRMSVDELQAGFLGLARELYSEAETSRRRRGFIQARRREEARMEEDRRTPSVACG